MVVINRIFLEVFVVFDGLMTSKGQELLIFAINNN